LNAFKDIINSWKLFNFFGNLFQPFSLHFLGPFSSTECKR